MGKRIKKKNKLSFKQRNKLKTLLLTDIADHLVKKLGSKEVCMSTNWVMSKILNLFHIKCKARRIFILFIDKKSQVIRDKRFKNAEFPMKRKFIRNMQEEIIALKFLNYLTTIEGTWNIGVWEDVVDSWNGVFHSVIEFENGSIMDMMADSMSRPKKNLIVNRFWELPNNLPRCILCYRWDHNPIIMTAIEQRDDLAEIMQYIINKIAKVLRHEPLQVMTQEAS